MPSLAEIEAKLLEPGGPCELEQARVLGESMWVFKNRARSLRELLERTRGFSAQEYIIYGDRRITYEEHLRTVAVVAQRLQQQFGVGKGDRVAVLAANCPEWIIAFWAAVSLGAIAVGLNGWWTRDEILYGLEDSEPKLLIGDAKRLKRLSGVKLDLPVIQIESEFSDLASEIAEVELPLTQIDEDDPACILYTSGTTGRPKGAVNTQRNIVSLVGLQLFHGLRMLMSAMDQPGAASGSAYTHCTLVTTPLFHVSGLYTGAISCLANGLKSVWVAGRFDPLRVIQLIEREKVTSWGPMGTMAHRLVNHPDVGRYDLGSMRIIGSGGAPMSLELQQRIREVFPNARASMALGYGLTEGTSLATLNYGEELEKYPDSVGRPLPTVEVEIHDSSGRVLPDGTDGEICLRGPLIMREYWRRKRETDESISPGRWLRTGDIGRINGGRLYVNSRARDLILRGAENIYPVEIEQRLEAHPDVEEAAVVGVDHEELGQEVKAFVVPCEGAALDCEDLARWVGERLAYFKVPAHWELRQQKLPRNAAGKVLKDVLMEKATNPFIED